MIFKLRLFGLIEFIVKNIKDLRHRVAEIRGGEENLEFVAKTHLLSRTVALNSAHFRAIPRNGISIDVQPSKKLAYLTVRQ